MIPVTISLPPHYRGDTWLGFAVGPVKFNIGTTDTPILISPPDAVSSCRIQFRDEKDILGYELSTIPAVGKGLINIVDAVAWTFIVPPQMLSLAAEKWFWDMEFIDTIGKVMTLYRGSIKIKQDITYG